MQTIIKPKAKIDTLQVATPITNVADTSVWSSEEKPYIKEKSEGYKEKDGVVSIGAVLHPSRTQARYDSSDNMYKFSTYSEVKGMMLEDLTVEVKDLVEINRLDICIDFKEPFRELLKVSHCITGLYAMETKAQKVWKNVGFWNDKVNGFNVKKREKWLTIYDKELESENNSIYKTRFEFRFIRQGTGASIDEVKKLNEVVQILDRLTGNLGAYEERMADSLYLNYMEQLAEGKVKNFTQFVNLHKDVIATSGMCEILYKKVGLKGSFKKWISKYRQANSIEFVSKTELNKFISVMKKAIKEFKKA